jgi:hypothetical protein
MISQHIVKGEMKLLKPGQNTVITAVIMINHVSEMEYCIQRERIECCNATVELGKGERVIPDPFRRAIAVLAIGKYPNPDGFDLLPAGIGTDVEKHQAKNQQFLPFGNMTPFKNHKKEIT